MADTSPVITSTDSVVRGQSDSIRDRDLLEDLGPGWRRIPTAANADSTVDRDDRDDRDILLVGPAGVVALSTRRRPGATVWVGARSVTVDGQHTVVLHNARSHAERSATLLSMASGRDIVATPAIVFAGLGGFNVQQMPRDVHVTTERRLRGWLASLPLRLEPDEIDAIALVR